MKARVSPERTRDPFVVFGVALAVALIVVFAVFKTQGLVANRPDPYEFSELGRRIARGEGFRGEIIGRRAPLYPLIIGVIYWVFGEHEVMVQLFQCLTFAGTALLAWDMGRLLFNRRTGMIAGLLCALHPSLLRYVPDFHLESVFAFLFTLCVWSSVQLYLRPGMLRGALFGISAGLACLTKAVLLLYPPLFIAILWLTRRRTRGPEPALPRFTISTAGVILVAMALTISPWTIRNYRVSGAIVPVSTGLSDAFLRGFVFSRTEFALLQKPPYTDAENEVNAQFRQECTAQGAVWEQDPLQTDKILSVAAKAKLRADLLGTIRKSVVGVFTFWYEMTSLKTSLVAGLLALAAWLLTFAGMSRAHRERKPEWLLLAPMLYLNAFLAVLLSLGRYSVPVLPCLMVTAAFGLDTLGERFHLSWPFGVKASSSAAGSTES